MFLQYWDVNDLYRWAILENLPVNSFEWTEDTFQFNEGFRKNYKGKSDERYFLEINVQYKLHELHNELPFYLEGWGLESRRACS